MSNYDKVVTLLGQTDGRDKIYKFLHGAFRIMSAVAAQRNDPHAQTYLTLVSTIRNARSLMRMGKFVADFTKMQALWGLFKAQGIVHTENKKFVEFVRVVCNAVYVLFDNVTFLCRFNVFDIGCRVDGKRCSLLSKRAQLLGYVMSLVFNLYELRDALRRLEYDPPAAKRASTRAAISALRDVADVLVTAATLRVGQPLWRPSEITAGALMCFSGALSTYLNWQKNK